MTYKTKGIILKRINLNEADRILTIYTQDRGKIKVIAKGIRKMLSKMAGHLEPFCLVDLNIAEGRNLDIVTDVQTIKCFIKLRDNLKTTNSAYYLAEIIEKIIHENESHPEIFDLLENSLEKLNSAQEKLLLAYFEINFLAEIGYRPELYKCLSCNKKISAGGNSFDFESGGLICKNCSKTAASMEISDSAIKIMRILLSRPVDSINKIKINHNVILEVEDIARKYLQYISQEEFKSRKFLS